MLLWSKQWKTVNDISLSFQKNDKIFTKISERILQRDQMFLNPNKYITYSESNFKFLVLWTCLKYGTNKIDTFKKIQSYTPHDELLIKQENQKIQFYNTTLSNDISVLNTYVTDFKIVQTLFNKGEISVLGTWWYLKGIKPQNRTQTKFFNKINFFMSYFNLKIKEENVKCR